MLIWLRRSVAPRLAGLVALCVLLPTLALAQPPDENLTFAQALSGEKYPLTLNLKPADMVGWTICALGIPLTVEAADAASRSGDMTTTLYLTKFEKITVEGQKYLIAYRPLTEQMRLTLNQFQANRLPETNGVTINFAFSLLRADSILSVSNVVKVTKEAFASDAPGPVEARATQSVSNLKQIGLGTLMYIQDYDEMLPYMKQPDATKRVIMPYIKNESVFTVPGTKTLYRTNVSLSRKPLASIDAPAEIVMWYEPAPMPDGTRGVCFVDGHARRIKEEEWPALARRSGIPLP